MAGRRDFCKVAPAIWTSKRFARLENKTKLLMLYLLTCPHQTSAGAFHVPAGYACTDLGWSSEAYSAGISELAASGLILFDHEEEEVFIHNWFKFNGITNPKHEMGTRKLIEALKSKAIQDAALKGFDAACPKREFSKQEMLARAVERL
jgi:hypothetical protein